MLFIRLAWRNLIRHRRRSLLTGLSMCLGFMVLSFSIGLTEGGYERLIALFTSMNTGHVQLLHPDYHESPTLYQTVKNLPSKLQQIREVPGVLAATARLEASGLAFAESKTSGVKLIGVEPESEEQVTSLRQRLAHGDWWSRSGEYQALLGSAVAQQLRLKTGDRMVVMTQAADGSMSHDFFEIIGVLKESFVDDYHVIVDLASLQEFLVLPQQAHRILLRARHYDQSRELQQQLRQQLESWPPLQWQTWAELEREFVHSMEVDKSGNIILYVIIGMVVGLSVLNTVLMALMERRREFGVMLALGTRPRLLLVMIMLEVACLLLLSLALACLMSTAINAYFMVHGIRFAEPVEFGGIMIDSMVSSLSWPVFVIPMLVVSISSLLVALIPAITVMRMRPTEAMNTV